MLALLALLSACYALPERHSVSRDPVDTDAGLDANGASDGKAEGAVDARDTSTVDADRDANPCDCADPAKSVCIEATKTCVSCTATDPGSCARNEFCNVLQGECVGCLQHTDCKDAKASVCNSETYQCQGCVEDADCGHITDKHVCLAGECVQCTKDKLAACVVQQSPTTSVQNVCHALSHTCTNKELGKTQICGDCVSDAECVSGHVCVGMDYDEVAIADRWYCLPVREEINCDKKGPFIGIAMGKKTIEGTTLDVCTLRASTCAALADYSNKFCGLDKDDRPIPVNDAGVPAAPSVKGNNEACGLPEIDDGYCVEARPGSHRCTIPCVSDVGDCPEDARSCPQIPHATGTRSLCAIP
jgi:hypothetical protein